MHINTEQDHGSVPQRNWFQHDGHQHGVQFYSADKFLIEELSRYVNHALHAGDAAVVVATEEHRESLIRRLSAQGIEIATAIEQGRFLALDAAQMLATFMIEGWPDQQRFNDVVGCVIEKAVAATDRGANPRVAIYGEMVALLWDQGKAEAAIRLEQLWNDLARSKSFSLFCGYPISSFGHERDADLLMKVCGEHSAVVPAEGYTGLVNEDDRRRTVVTGHDAKGRAVFVRDEQVDGTPIPGIGELAFLWNADEPATYPNAGNNPAAPGIFPPVGGIRYIIGTYLPGVIAPEPTPEMHLEDGDEPGGANDGFHRTDTTDFGVLISGKMALKLDDGAEVVLSPGDVLIENGTRHRWRVVGDVPATLASFIIGARRH